MRATLRRTAAALVLALVTAVGAIAAVPSAPAQISGNWQSIGGPPTVNLYWSSVTRDSNVTTGEDVDGFYVYESYNGGTFNSVDTVVNPGDTMGFAYGSYAAQVSEAGEYRYYVIAFNGDGASDPSATVTLNVTSADWVIFNLNGYTSTDINVGSTLTETFTATATNGGAITYTVNVFGPGSDEISIDETTGEFTWTPQRSGVRRATVYAWLGGVNSSTYDTLQVYLQAFGDTIPQDTSVVRFTRSNVRDVIDVNTPYTYDYDAVADNGEALTYSIVENAASGATIDATTGLFSWTPTTTGQFLFRIRAALASDPTVYAEALTYIGVVGAAAAPQIFGTVLDDKDDTFVPGTITAYRKTYDSTGNGLSVVWVAEATTIADSGSYRFGPNSLSAGTYVFYVEPNSGYSPGYYRDDKKVSNTWQAATEVLVVGQATDTVIFYVKEINGQGGSTLDGYVVDQGGVTTKTDAVTQSQVPVAGATVYAIAADGEIHGYDVTDDAGYFQIEGLEAGEYTIVIDKLGFTAENESVTIDMDGDEVSMDPISIQNVSGTSGVKVDVVAGSSMTVYPNPARDRFEVSFESRGGSATVRVLNVRGQEMSAKAVSLRDGENNVTVETENLTNGLYFVLLQTEAGTTQRAIVIAR